MEAEFTANQLSVVVDERTISRREFLRRGASLPAAALVFAGVRRLSDGIKLKEYPLVIQPRKVGKRVEGAQNFSEGNVVADEEWFASTTLKEELIFDRKGDKEFFSDERKIKYVHRGGSSKETIKKAYDMGANLFDVDANDFPGELYGEHGIIPNTEILGVSVSIPVVIDINEWELKLGMPDTTYEELIAFIGTLSASSGEPLAVSTELKRGKFRPDVINEMLVIHHKHNVPLMINPSADHTFTLLNNVSV